MPRKPAEDFPLVETQDSTIAKMVIGATKRFEQLPGNGSVLHKYAGLIGNIRYYAAALDNFCACNADYLDPIMDDYDLAGAVGARYLDGCDGITIYDLIEIVLRESPLSPADLDSIYGY